MAKVSCWRVCGGGPGGRARGEPGKQACLRQVAEKNGTQGGKDLLADRPPGGRGKRPGRLKEAIPDSIVGPVRNQQSSEENRLECPELPQAGRSEPEKAGGEGRPASGLYQPCGARDKGRVGGGAVETIAGVAGADSVAGAGRVKGSGWGLRTVLARGQWTKRGEAATQGE